MFQGGMVDLENDKNSLNRFGLGAEIGYQWVWDSGFTIDLGIGPMYNIVKTNSSSFEKLGFLLPSATLGVGFAF